MRKFALVFVAAFGLCCFGLTGCGEPKTAVIEAPPTNEPEMTPEEQAEYDRSMNESMNQPGN